MRVRARSTSSVVVGVAFALAILEIPLWLIIASTLFIAWPMPIDAPRPMNPLTAACFLLALLNFVALVAFALRRRGYGYWLLAMVQPLDVIALYGLRLMHGPFDDSATNVMLAVTVASLAAVILLILAPLTFKLTEKYLGRANLD